MHAIFKPTQGIVRFYESGSSYDARDPYVGIANVLFLDDSHVAIVGMHGKITRAGLASLYKELWNMGVRTILAERNGKHITYHLEEYFDKASKYEANAIAKE